MKHRQGEVQREYSESFYHIDLGMHLASKREEAIQDNLAARLNQLISR